MSAFSSDSDRTDTMLVHLNSVVRSALWTPAGTLIRTIGKSATSVVCVVPTSTASAVDVVTVSAGKIVDRTHVDTDGQPHALAKQGCTGWQSAKWSPSAHRVYLKSEVTCSGAPAPHVSAV